MDLVYIFNNKIIMRYILLLPSTIFPIYLFENPHKTILCMVA